MEACVYFNDLVKPSLEVNTKVIPSNPPTQPTVLRMFDCKGNPESRAKSASIHPYILDASPCFILMVHSSTRVLLYRPHPQHGMVEIPLAPE